jgi:hypothetical protein
MVLGISRWARANSTVDTYKLNDSADEASRYISQIVASPAWITTVNGVANDNWIPGDWGHYSNTAFSTLTWQTGYEGHNFIYIGQGMTILYGDKKSFSAVETEMRRWTSRTGVHGRPALDGWRNVPSPVVFSRL